MVCCHAGSNVKTAACLSHLYIFQCLIVMLMLQIAYHFLLSFMLLMKNLQAQEKRTLKAASGRWKVWAFVYVRETERKRCRLAVKVMVLLMVSGYFVHQSPQKKEKERTSEGERGKSAAGHLIVIVSLRSCGSAEVLLLFFFYCLSLLLFLLSR